MTTAVEKVKTEAKAPKVIKAYKAFDPDWKCRGFQYTVGETYVHGGKVEACKSGFHACENPLDVLNYYDLRDSKFASVELSGEIARHGNDSKIAGGKITIKAEIGLPKLISAAISYLLSLAKCDDVQTASDYYSQLAASGDYSKLAASGDYSQLAASGDHSQLAASGGSSIAAASGDYSQLAASGDYSQLAASGDYSKLAASGGSSIAVASAPNCIAKAGELGCIALSRWVGTEKRYRLSVAYVGENGIKANTWYSLNDEGEFVEVTA